LNRRLAGAEGPPADELLCAPTFEAEIPARRGIFTASPMPTSLSRATMLQLQAAEGWVELGRPAEAVLELEAIHPEERELPPVLEMFWHVYAHWKKWQPAYEVATRLVDQFPELPAGWIDRSFALRRIKGGGLQAAHDALLPAVKRFPFEPVIPYNLACYCAQLEQVTAAREWLEQAMVIGDRRALLRMANNDPDLESLKALGYLK
jgi:predicted Zn-dependent protease